MVIFCEVTTKTHVVIITKQHNVTRNTCNITKKIIIARMKRKEYKKPDIKVIKLKSQPELLNESGGHKNACAHGANAPFCN